MQIAVVRVASCDRWVDKDERMRLPMILAAWNSGALVALGSLETDGFPLRALQGAPNGVADSLSRGGNGCGMRSRARARGQVYASGKLEF